MSPSWNQSINSVWCELHPCVSVSQICSQLSERLEKQQTLNKGELEKIRVRLSHAQTAFIQTAHLVSLAVHVGTNSSRSNNFFKTFATNLKKYLPKNLNSFIMWRPVFYLPLLDYWKKLQKRCKGAKICHKTGPYVQHMFLSFALWYLCSKSSNGGTNAVQILFLIDISAFWMILNCEFPNEI